MNPSSPVSILLASVFITLLAIKVKEKCHYCFLGLFSVGLILFIFGLLKYWRRRHG